MAVEFETVKAEEVKFGRNSFIEVARKIARPDDGETNEFVSLSKGYYMPDGTKRFKKGQNLTMPTDKEVVTEIIDKLRELSEDMESGTSQPAPEEASAEEAPAEDVATEEEEAPAEDTE